MKEDYIESQFVTYELALAFKELGFDECCLAVYFKDKFQLIKGFNINNVDLHVANKMDAILAPLWSQVIDWLDSEFGLLIVIVHDKKFGYQWKITTNKNKVVYDCAVTYQRLCDAREIAILKCIELCKKKQ